MTSDSMVQPQMNRFKTISNSWLWLNQTESQIRYMHLLFYKVRYSLRASSNVNYFLFYGWCEGDLYETDKTNTANAAQLQMDRV